MRARVLALGVLLVTVFAVFAYRDSTARVGRAAPAFRLAAAGGGAPVTLGGLRGRVVLLDFFATWCTVCQQDAPVLSAFARRYSSRVTLVGIDWREPASALNAWVSTHELPYTNLRDGDGSVASRYGLTGVPELWWIGPDGTARLHVVGPADFEQLQAEYRQVTGVSIDGPGVGPVGSGDRAAGLAVGGGAVWLAVRGAGGGLWSAPASGGAWTRSSLAGTVSQVAAAGADVVAVGSRAEVSVDGGRTWTALRGPAPAAVAVTDTPQTVAYMWAGGRLLRWRPGAQAPSPVSRQPPVAGAAVAVLAASGSRLAVATATSVFVSADGGTSWAREQLRRQPLGTAEFSSPSAALTGTVPVAAAGAAWAPDGSLVLAGPDGVYEGSGAGNCGSSCGQRLAAAPARAFAAVAAGPDGALWAVAPNGDVYRGAAAAGPWALRAGGGGGG